METREQRIERILRKNFQKVNREGLGFLETNIARCKKDLIQLICKEPLKHQQKQTESIPMINVG